MYRRAVFKQLKKPNEFRSGSALVSVAMRSSSAPMTRFQAMSTLDPLETAIRDRKALWEAVDIVRAQNPNTIKNVFQILLDDLDTADPTTDYCLESTSTKIETMKALIRARKALSAKTLKYGGTGVRDSLFDEQKTQFVRMLKSAHVHFDGVEGGEIFTVALSPQNSDDPTEVIKLDFVPPRSGSAARIKMHYRKKLDSSVTTDTFSPTDVARYERLREYLGITTWIPKEDGSDCFKDFLEVVAEANNVVERFKVVI